jgi:hypothetical protein
MTVPAGSGSRRAQSIDQANRIVALSSFSTITGVIAE